MKHSVSTQIFCMFILAILIFGIIMCRDLENNKPNNYKQTVGDVTINDSCDTLSTFNIRCMSSDAVPVPMTGIKVNIRIITTIYNDADYGTGYELDMSSKTYITDQNGYVYVKCLSNSWVDIEIPQAWGYENGFFIQ